MEQGIIIPFHSYTPLNELNAPIDDSASTKIMKMPVQKCPTCGHIISKRQIALYSGMVSTLYRVFRWCEEKGRHEFETKEVKQFFNLNSSARFGDWVMFGGLVYKSKKAHYGINMQRCDQFFKGQYKIPESVLKNPITGQIEQWPDITIKQVKGLVDFLNKDGEFQARYFKNYYQKVNVLNSDGSVQRTITLPNL